MSSELVRFAEMRYAAGVAAAALLAIAAAGCATTGTMGHGRAAEQAQDFDRAVIEYTSVVRSNPGNRDARAALQRVKLRAAQDHTARARRYAGLERYEEAAVEYQLAAELNPTDSAIEAALRDVRQKLRTKVAVSREGAPSSRASSIAPAQPPPPASTCRRASSFPDRWCSATAQRRGRCSRPWRGSRA